MEKFPEVKIKCPYCGSGGKVDISRHGSAEWVDCHRCKGVSGVEYYRQMTVDEKIDFLLKRTSTQDQAIDKARWKQS